RDRPVSSPLIRSRRLARPPRPIAKGKGERGKPDKTENQLSPRALDVPLERQPEDPPERCRDWNVMVALGRNALGEHSDVTRDVSTAQPHSISKSQRVCDPR